ncbi:hypothetical protein EVA_10681 [gut metagenome]|uniref:Uncharacterized protein n=1 Tax=gut metagenome TaxID=749906 RepID=J9GMX8_9ZZZZ
MLFLRGRILCPPGVICPKAGWQPGSRPAVPGHPRWW